ncbi:MAG: eukaryotic initiation factor 4A-II-like protein [Benniella sp.]|nr:MAG: eukaryotic initiation factor 4A-II-like protein [Benniella sp.]
MRLDKGSHIVVGTPSCVQEIIKHDALTTKNIGVVVLDRVDEILSGGSKDIIEDLLQSIPRSAQVVFLLSKTFTELKDMAKKFMRGPVFISHTTEEPDLDDSETLTGSVRPSDDKLDETESNHDEAFGSFEEMNLNAELLRGIAAYGMERPSVFQQRIIQPTLRNQDLIIQAQSGPDKVIAFCISVLQKLNPSNKQCQALILAPAHEMAQEIQEAILALGNFMGIQCHACVGGTDVKGDIDRLRQGGHVVVGTFGRIQDLVKRRILRTDSIKMFIMDVMNSKTILDQMEDITQRFPPGVQIVYLSPRVSNQAVDIMTKLMREPLYVMAKKDILAVEDVRQFYVLVDTEESKLGALCSLCTTIPATHVVIFCNTPQKIDWLKEQLTAREFSVGAIQGSMEQTQREDVMKAFSLGTYRVLISTDLLLGDNDVQEVKLVINFDMPTGKKKYSRRVGLIGRDGNKGLAINIVTDKETIRMKRFEQFYLTPIQAMSLEDPVEE